MIVFYIGPKDLTWVEEDTIADVIEVRGLANSNEVEIIPMKEEEARPDKFHNGDFLFIERKEVASYYRKSLRGKGVKIYRVREYLVDVIDKTEEILSWTSR